MLVNFNLVTKQTCCSTFFIMKGGGKEPYVIQVKICMCVLGSWKKLAAGNKPTMI